jgi:glycolate oxidase
MQMPQPDPSVIARKAAIVARLRAALPPEVVLADPAELRAYE